MVVDWALNPMASTFKKQKREKWREEQDRRIRRPGSAGSPRSRKRPGGFSPSASRPAETLTSDIRALELWENTFPFVEATQFVAIFSRSLRKLVQVPASEIYVQDANSLVPRLTRSKCSV